jgi:Helix-turn-helix domain
MRARERITAEQQEVILHPERMRIVGEFVFGETLTASDLHERLPEMAVATLYRHLALLTKTGVLTVHATEAKRGASEKTYVIAVNVMFSSGQIMKHPGRFLQVATVAATALIRCVARYVKRANLSHRTVDPRLRFYPVSATDDEYRALVETLERTLGDAARSRPESPSSPRRMFFLAAVPEFE